MGWVGTGTKKLDNSNSIKNKNKIKYIGFCRQPENSNEEFFAILTVQSVIFFKQEFQELSRIQWKIQGDI